MLSARESMSVRGDKSHMANARLNAYRVCLVILSVIAHNM